MDSGYVKLPGVWLCSIAEHTPHHRFRLQTRACWLKAFLFCDEISLSSCLSSSSEDDQARVFVWEFLGNPCQQTEFLVGKGQFEREASDKEEYLFELLRLFVTQARQHLARDTLAGLLQESADLGFDSLLISLFKKELAAASKGPVAESLAPPRLDIAEVRRMGPSEILPTSRRWSVLATARAPSPPKWRYSFDQVVDEGPDCETMAKALTLGTWRAFKRVSAEALLQAGGALIRSGFLAEYNEWSRGCSVWASHAAALGHTSFLEAVSKHLLQFRNYDTLVCIVLALQRAGRKEAAMQCLGVKGLLDPDTPDGSFSTLLTTLEKHVSDGVSFIPLVPVLLGQITTEAAEPPFVRQIPQEALPIARWIQIWKHWETLPCWIDDDCLRNVAFVVPPLNEALSIMTARDWTVLQPSEVLRLEAGALVLKEGAYNSSFYRVLEGELDVKKHGMTIGHVGVGSIFGELSVLAAQTPLCGASVIAASACVVARIDSGFIKTILREDVTEMATRFYTLVGTQMALRLRQMCEKSGNFWMSSLRSLADASEYRPRSIEGGLELQSSSSMESVSSISRSSSGTLPSVAASSPARSSSSLSSSGSIHFSPARLFRSSSKSSAPSSSLADSGRSSVEMAASPKALKISAQLDSDMRSKVGSKADEVVCIASYACAYRGRMGKMFCVSSRELHFVSRIFYVRHRLTIPLASVEDISCNDLELNVTVARNHKSYSFTNFAVPVQSVLELCLALMSQTSAAPQASRAALAATTQKASVTLLGGPHSQSSLEEALMLRGLESNDWDVLVCGSRTITFQTGDIVVQQGEVAQGLFHVAKGKLDVLVNGTSAGCIKKGDMFGELAFLPLGGIANATIVAAETAIVNLVPKYYVEYSFTRFEGLSNRFFEFVAHLVADRLRSHVGVEREAMLKWEANRGRQQRFLAAQISALEDLIEAEDRGPTRSCLTAMLSAVRLTGSCNDALKQLVQAGSLGDDAAAIALVVLARKQEWRQPILQANGLPVLERMAFKRWEGGERDAWEKGAVYSSFDPAQLVIDWKQPIGAGAFSTVYRALLNNKGVAVKEVQQNKMFDPGTFRRELCLHLLLSTNAHIIGFFGCFQLHGKYYVVTPLAELGSLSQVYARGDLSGCQTSLKIMMLLDVTKGLRWMHRHGVVHRDLKSSNVLVVDKHFKCVLGDLGISRTECDQTQVVGTLLYASPELFRVALKKQAPLSSLRMPSDIYAFGYLLYELFMEQDGFDEQAYEAAVREKERRLDQHQPPLDIPPSCPWGDLLLQCWSENEQDRPDAAEIGQSLKTLLPVFQ